MQLYLRKGRGDKNFSHMKIVIIMKLSICLSTVP